jgi:galactose mutarotase-like enzyme
MLRMAAGRWHMEIRPERGGRITSLRLDGEELLDRGIGVDEPTAKGFVDGGAFGWDEMVPNLEPTESLPDHGEAWRLPWEVLGEGVMRCRGRLVPWELERRIVLADAVSVDYRYRNVGDEPHGAFWCAHPLFKYQPVMDMDVAEGTSIKLFLAPGSVDRVGVGPIEVSWDPALTPNVAIWMCNGDLGGYRQVAVEPSTDSPVLEPGEQFGWWLRISPA